MEDDRAVIVDEIYVNPRKKEQRLRRKSDADLEDMLKEDMLRAGREIAKFFGLITAGLSYGTLDPNRIKGQGGEYSDDTMNALTDYRTWAKRQPRLHYAIALDVCYFGFTARQTAEMRGKSHPTIMKYLRESLNDYCIARGWGSQMRIDDLPQKG